MTFTSIIKDPNPVTSPLDGSTTNTDQWNNLIDILNGVSTDKVNCFTPVDDEDAISSMSGATTTTLRTYTGKGWMFIDIAGDGDTDVEVRYSKNGASDVIVCNSDQGLKFGVGFTTSLAIKVKNTNVGTKNYSTIAESGFYQ